MDRWGFSGWFSVELPLVWERFLAAWGENSSNLCHVLADVLERKRAKWHYFSITELSMWSFPIRAYCLAINYNYIHCCSWLAVCLLIYWPLLQSSADVLSHYRLWCVLRNEQRAQNSYSQWNQINGFNLVRAVKAWSAIETGKAIYAVTNNPWN